MAKKQSWPSYSWHCQRAVASLLRRGGSLTAYHANPTIGVEPQKGSWAWRLEKLAQKKTGVNAVACSSATLALWAAIKAMQLPPSGEIITTPLTFSATPAAIRLAGYEPVFADVDENGLLDVESVQRTLSPSVRAILPVDLFGLMPDYTRLKALGVPVIEDASQAVGAIRNNHLAGTFGEVGVWSFNGTKNVPAGEGGMLLSAYHDLTDRARYFLSHGENFGRGIGLNGHLNEVSACLAYFGLRDVEANNAKRVQLARRLALQLPSWMSGPPLPRPCDHALYVYPLMIASNPIRVEGGRGNRTNCASYLRSYHYAVSEGYIQPTLDRYPAFQRCRVDPHGLFQAYFLSTERLLLLFDPLRPPARLRDVDLLGRRIQQWATVHS